jgi:hypothetical protein
MAIGKKGYNGKGLKILTSVCHYFLSLGMSGWLYCQQLLLHFLFSVCRNSILSCNCVILSSNKEVK